MLTLPRREYPRQFRGARWSFLLADFDIAAFYLAADALRESRGLTWAAATRQINAPILDVPGSRPMATATITGMQGKKTMIEGDSGLQVLMWLERTPESFVPGLKSDPDAHALHQPGAGKILRWDLAKMYLALDSRRGKRGMTWRNVAAEIEGFGPSMLTRMVKGGRTSFPRVMRVVGWLDLPAASFTRASSR